MRIYYRNLLCLLPLFLACCSFSQPVQTEPSTKAAPALLTVRGVASKDVVLTEADLEKLPHRSVQVNDKSGDKFTFEGVTLAEALKKAGMDFGANQHGRGLTRYLLVEAADKYRVVFSLPEIDPDFTDRLILLATKKEGKPLSNEEGPLHIIVPDDKRQARWIKQVRILTIVDAVAPADRNQKP